VSSVGPRGSFAEVAPAVKRWRMSQLVDRALRQRTEPLSEGEAALALFRTVYTDPLDEICAA
jgi:hypothetical protein